jgi:putative membrane protein
MRRYLPSPLWARIILVVTYAVGIAGLSIPLTRPWFLLLTPVHLLLTAGLLLLAFPRFSKAMGWTALAIYTLGWGAEAVGVHTGKLFGEYAYGATLGPRVWGIPLVIGVNWLMLTLATVGSLQLLGVPRWQLPILGSITMVALDYLIEPVAVRLDMWHWWYGLAPPLQNYLTWAALSAALIQLWLWADPPPNKLAPWVLLCQFAFFAALILLG